MFVDEKDPVENADTTTGDVEVKEEQAKEEKPTLDTLAKQNKELNEKLEKVIKQNSDKDSHITRIQNENKELRGKVENISSSLAGKTDRQKDAILERHREKFIEAGYDEKSVDLILNTITDIADKKADGKITKIVTDAAMELIESDADIDQEFVTKNEAEIMAEYNSYKLDEISARKMKSNFKKAYKQVKERLAEKAKTIRKAKDDDTRDTMIEGGKPTQSSKKQQTDEDELVRSIEGAGGSNSHFI